jgi:hypothetical protein
MNYICEKCGKKVTVDDIGYLGPRDRASEECHPFVDFVCTCKDCEFGVKPPLEETT